MNKFDHKIIDKKWQNFWQENEIYKTVDDENKPKYYCLDMFPYPSGTGLHVGHPKGYIATDILARLKMMQGFNVLHPMGWDAFGLPAENYALKNKVHPKVATDKNIAVYKKQLEILGLAYDWNREVNTTDSHYYKWTQWAFLKMFERGLVYESNEPINWCPSCKTGLANEDLEDGKCERCGNEVEQKPIRQWVIRITDYAERLLADLEKLPDWEEPIKEMQKNWIGKSEGAEIKFAINNEQLTIDVFTTRVDTIFGCTYVVLAPENELVEKLKAKISNWDEVSQYIEKIKNKTNLERTDLNKDKTGVELKGIKAINPFNNEEIKVFIADYVLNSYGTGAVMAVPAHDERDFEFAKKYNLEIKPVISKYIEFWDEKTQREGLRLGSVMTRRTFDSEKVDTCLSEDLMSSLNEQILKITAKKAFIDDGWVINSGKMYSGYKSEYVREKMIDWLEKNNLGKRKINYKIKDWVFSRQRYWGEPIPLIHCEKCGVVGVDENELPLELPVVENYEPSGTGESPLVNITDWVNTTCPKCGGKAKRETNTMPQWAGSCWYYLRYIDPKNNEVLVNKIKEKYWSPVDFYVGGAEHATRHLIYARFWHKFLFDIGAVNYDEPFTKLQHVGLILASDGRKMSKRWNNVVNPDDMIDKYGADSLRIYEMFMGPFGEACAWNTNGLIGARKFLEKVYSLSEKINDNISSNTIHRVNTLLHKTIKKIGEDIVNFKFNTAVSSMMILTNKLIEEENISKDNFEILIKILAPFAPHICEELWFSLGNKGSIFKATWPEYNKDLLQDEQVNISVQVNGKLRDNFLIDVNLNEEDIREIVLNREKIKTWLEGKTLLKFIYIKNKLVNLVIS